MVLGALASSLLAAPLLLGAPGVALAKAKPEAKRPPPPLVSLARIRARNGVTVGAAARQLGTWARGPGAGCVRKHLGKRRRGRVEAALTLHRNGKVARLRLQRFGVPGGLQRCFRRGLAKLRFNTHKTRGKDKPLVRVRIVPSTESWKQRLRRR